MKQEKHNERLLTLAELLYVPLVFHVLTQWRHDDNWQTKTALILIFFLVQVEYLSIKQSYRIYHVRLYFLDFFSFVMYFLALDALSDRAPPQLVGYDPIFWLFIALLWLGYAIWDFLMSSKEANAVVKAKLRLWGFKMVGFFIVGFTCWAGIEYLLDRPSTTGNANLLVALQLVPLFLVIWSLVEWIQDVAKDFGMAEP